ncbi:MAG: cfp30B [Thermoleophilia bacterium]|nr:cfp30B [Thermoleophilia bacterium]
MAMTAAAPRKNALKTTNGFWWANLASTDDTAAAAFYTDVFGWSWDVMPLGDSGNVHRTAKAGDLELAGLDHLPADAGMPTNWTNFVYVDDIAATVETARALGAKIMMEPMDVMGAGHMAVAFDPTGAAFGLWQPGTQTGADAVNQPNTYSWVELATDDTEAARTFYAELLGWNWVRQDMEMEYWIAELEGRSHAGMMPKLDSMSSMPNHWGTYYGVADVDATVTAIKAAGGTVLMDPVRMGPGRGTAALDPQGGYFLVIQLDEWPAD